MSALVLSEVLVMTVIDCLHCLYPVLIIVLFSIQLSLMPILNKHIVFGD